MSHGHFSILALGGLHVKTSFYITSYINIVSKVYCFISISSRHLGNPQAGTCGKDKTLWNTVSTNVTTDWVTEDTVTVSWNKVEAPLDKYMGRYTSADGDTKENGGQWKWHDHLTGSEARHGICHWHLAREGPQRRRKASTRTVTDEL